MIDSPQDQNLDLRPSREKVNDGRMMLTHLGFGSEVQAFGEHGLVQPLGIMV